ncbi:MAG TPA: hypothetical protein VFQ30_05055 [Ktedonobacteraceae bacterium]|nr:hypothetical protein [Ktedonobacteraceae bacterium]
MEQSVGCRLTDLHPSSCCCRLPGPTRLHLGHQLSFRGAVLLFVHLFPS